MENRREPLHIQVEALAVEIPIVDMGSDELRDPGFLGHFALQVVIENALAAELSPPLRIDVRGIPYLRSRAHPEILAEAVQIHRGILGWARERRYGIPRTSIRS